MKLKSKITYSVLVVLFIAIGTLGYIYLQASTSSIQREVSENFSLLCKSYATQIDLQLKSYKLSIRDLSSAIITSVYAGDALREASRLYPEFEDVFYTDMEGKIIDMYPYNAEEMKIDFSKKEFWIKTVETEEIQITTNNDFGYPAIILSAPVVLPFLTNELPTTYGAVCITIPVDYFFREYQEITIGETGFIFIIDQNDTIILHKDRELILNKKLYELSDDKSLKEVADSMNNSNSGNGFYEFDKNKYYISFYPIFNANWSLAITGLIDEYHAEARSLSLFLFGIFMIVVTPTVFIIFSMVNRIVMPLRNIQDLLRKMASGELKTNTLLEQDTHDEIGEMSQDFNKIIRNLENIARELNIDLEKEKKALSDTILRFHAIFDQSSQNIWIMDLRGKILEANDSFYRTMGQKRGQILNRYFWELQFISNRKKRVDEIKAAISKSARNKTSRLELNIRDIFKKVYVLDMTIQPVLDSNGNVVLIIGEGRDITNRKKVELELDIYRSHLEEMIESRTEELKKTQKELLIKEKFAALGQLTAIVSHEIRNPLATIRSSAYLIKEKTKDQNLKIESTIGRLERNVSRCDQIIEELLDYSRTPTLTFKPLKIDDWLSVLIKNFTFEDNIKVITSFNADVFVSIDTENFRRVIINLIVNANQAFANYENTEKEFEITIKTSTSNEFVKISISDNGPGIPDDIKSKIFEPLFSTKSFGVGLGLPIVQQIVNQHSGTIKVISEPDKGAEFIIQVPVTEKSEGKN